MPDLSIRFKPARLYKLREALLPSSHETADDGLLAVSREEPTPWAALLFLFAFIFFSYGQFAAWLPGHPPALTTTVAPTGLSWLVIQLRLSLTPALLSLLAIIFYKSSRGESFRFTGPQTHLVFGFMLCAIISVPLSMYAAKSLNLVYSDIVKLVALYLLTINVVRNMQSFRLVIWCLLIAGLMPAVGTLLNNFWPDVFVPFFLKLTTIDLQYAFPSGRYGWAGYFLNANYVARTLLLLIPLALCLFEITRSAFKKTVLVGFIGLYTLTMLKMLSRSAMLSLACIVLVYIITSRKKAVSTLLIIVMAMGSLAVLPQVIQRAKTLTNIEQDASAMSRIDLWLAGIDLGMHRPLWGVGAGCFSVATAEYFPKYTDQKSLRWLEAHNSYVQAFAEMGIQGLIVFVSILGFTLRDTWKIHRRLRYIQNEEAQSIAGAARAIMLSLLTICLVSMTGNYLYDWNLYMIIGLIVSLKHMARRFEPEL